jgi:hypothetical protein
MASNQRICNKRVAASTLSWIELQHPANGPTTWPSLSKRSKHLPLFEISNEAIPRYRPISNVSHKTTAAHVVTLEHTLASRTLIPCLVYRRSGRILYHLLRSCPQPATEAPGLFAALFALWMRGPMGQWSPRWLQKASSPRGEYGANKRISDSLGPLGIVICEYRSRTSHVWIWAPSPNEGKEAYAGM